MERRVVITGLGTLNPLGLNVSITWEKVRRAESGIDTVPAFQEAGLPIQVGGIVPPFEAADFLGRQLARRTNRTQHMAMIAAYEALVDAGLVGYGRGDLHRVGVILGSSLGGISALVDNAGIFTRQGPKRVNPFLITMLLPDSAASLIAIEYGFCGPTMNISTGCVSATNAIGEAARMIAGGQADIIVSGGAESPLSPVIMAGFYNVGSLTRNNDPACASRPFDRERDGFVPAEGAAILILEEQEHALARGAGIYAELLGYGNGTDAYHLSAPDEHGRGAARAMKRALDAARLKPEDVDYINAHGTGTRLNDKSETRAIKQVFKDQAYQIPVSSTKSLHGHLWGAAGALESLIAIKAMQENQIPPTVNYATPDPECDLDYVPNHARPGNLRTVLSHSTGMGGHNATLIFGRPTVKPT